MLAFIRFVDPNRSLEVFGVKLVAINAESGKKLLLSVALIVAITLLSGTLQWIARKVLRRAGPRVTFWVRQSIHIFAALVVIVGVVSIWFDQPGRLATAAGLVTAGVAFALQKVITAFAGYIVILRGNAFSVGDRITMGGVRGDVIALGFIQTTIMEMGQAPGEQSDEPALWVKARQYTGRIVTVTNDKVFDTPVYNYTRDFPYIWEEMTLPINYKDDRGKVERLLCDVATRHAVKIDEIAQEDLCEMERRFNLKWTDLGPRVYWRLTDNWLQMTVRFITLSHGVRDVKDAMSREVLEGLDQAGIGIASSTYDIVGMPPLRIVRERPAGRQT
jgi:small-conductance mechanosensitive channel